jgi:cell wall-associated NlpC family hydrolase
MSWVNTYIGIPFVDLGRTAQGFDCWGAARLVYKQELNISLPSYVDGYACADERNEIAGLISDAQSTGPWRKRTGSAHPFDLLVFRRGKYQSHIGVAVDARLMLHVVAEDQAKVERFNQPRWQSRLIGAFQYVQMPVQGRS